MQTSRIVHTAVVAMAATLGVVAWPQPTRAEEVFPGALQEAAGLNCAPSCTVCHTTNPGTAGTFTKKLGFAVFNRGARPGSGEEGLKMAYAKLVEDAKGTGMPAMEAADLVAKLQAGLDPESGAELCQITYGCGARIAKDEPRDDWSGLLFVAGAMGFGALLRRTKRR